MEILGSLFNFILCLGIIFGLGYVFVWFTKPRFIKGQITGSKLQFSPYEYIMGNNIFDGASGHGIQVLLPKYLPEIYIDSHNDGRSNTAISYITKGQKLMLEGNFNDYFQVFCAPAATNMVLTILTPDVMAVLIDASEKYDVRLRGRMLQIFSNGKLQNKPKKQAAILSVAEKLVAELDHKMKTFKDNPANEIVLSVQANQNATKIGKYYVRTGSLAYLLVTGFIAAVFYLFSFISYTQHTEQAIVLLFFWLGFAVFPCLAIFLVFANSVDLFDRLGSSRKLNDALSMTKFIVNIVIALAIVCYLAYAFLLNN